MDKQKWGTIMKKTLGLCAVVGVLTSLTACTTVKPSYVSPAQYQTWNCSQLQNEYNRIGQYLKAGVEAPKRTGMGVGLGLGGGWGRGGWGFGPTISVNLGQSSNTKRTEKANLLGQQDAIVQAGRFKGCSI